MPYKVQRFLQILYVWPLLKSKVVWYIYNFMCCVIHLFLTEKKSFIFYKTCELHVMLNILVLIVERIFQTSFFDSSSSTIRMLLDGYCRTESSYDTTSDLSPFGHLIWGVSPVGWRSISRRCYYSMSASNDPKVTMNYVPLKYPTNSQLNVSPVQLLLSWIPNCS